LSQVDKLTQRPFPVQLSGQTGGITTTGGVQEKNDLSAGHPEGLVQLPSNNNVLDSLVRGHQVQFNPLSPDANLHSEHEFAPSVSQVGGGGVGEISQATPLAGGVQLQFPSIHTP